MARDDSNLLRILDCSRGLSDWYPARLDDDQLADAWDVEFWDGAVCGRRNGCILRISGSPGVIGYSLFVHTPTTSRANDKLALAWKNPSDGADYMLLYDPAWVSTNVASVPDFLNFSQGVDWASLHGKLFIATKSAANRLHVYDGVTGTIRPTGLKLGTMTAPVVTNVPGGTSYTGTRNFRIRWTRQVGGATVLRSEPTNATTFVPTAGNSIGATISVDATGTDPGVTHWELEQLAPSGFWYRVNTLALPTNAINDALALSQIASVGVLSEDVGDYTLQYSARWLTVDEDRLILGGSFDEEKKSARVSWTQIGTGTGSGQFGVGNDERLPSDVDGYLDFDVLDGGGLTGVKAWEGKVIVFKRSQVHQMVRSSSRLRAYLPDTLSRRHGAIPFSIVEGTDVDGLSCLYFLDPEVGPMQLGFKGLRVLAPNMQRTWRSDINQTATVVASVTYHPEKRQVWWHVATGGSQFPNLRWMYSVESDGLVFHTLAAPVKSATSWLGKPTLLHDATASFNAIIGHGDQPTMIVDYDDAHRYRAYVTTKAYQLGSLLRRFQIDSAILEASMKIGAVVHVICRRDFGVETRTVAVLLTSPYLVDLNVIPVDNSYMTEAISMQFEIGDIQPLNALDVGGWQVHGLTLAWSLGSPTTGRG